MQHWRYFLMIEEEILGLRKYIEFDKANYETYSLELCRQLTSICSEVDILFKDICGKLKGGSASNILEYRKLLRCKQEDFRLTLPDSRVRLTQTDLDLNPFGVLYKSNKKQVGKKCIDDFEKIDWWSANNDIKHDRAAKYEAGNLGNVLKAGAALFVLNLLRGELLGESNLIPSNKLFTLSDVGYAYSSLLVGGNGAAIFYVKP